MAWGEEAGWDTIEQDRLIANAYGDKIKGEIKPQWLVFFHRASPLEWSSVALKAWLEWQCLKAQKIWDFQGYQPRKCSTNHLQLGCESRCLSHQAKWGRSEWEKKWVWDNKATGDRGEKKVEKKNIKRFSISLCTVLSLELHYSSMLKLLAFRTFEVRDFLIFIVPGTKNLALISTLCQIYAL